MRVAPNYSSDYLKAVIAMAEVLPLETQKRIATTFTALELEVGYWHGFFHYRLINAEQYANATGLTPAQVMARVRYGNELVAWWEGVGYPFIRGSHFLFRDSFTRALPAKHLLQYTRQAVFAAWGADKSAERYWWYGPAAQAWRRELKALYEWSLVKLPDDEQFRGWLRTLDGRLRAGRTRRSASRCVYGGREHPGQSCLLCAFPASWNLVEKRYPGGSPLAAIGVRRGERPQERTRSPEVP